MSGDPIYRSFEEWQATEGESIGLTDRERRIARLAWNRAMLTVTEQHTAALQRLLETSAG